LVRQQPQSRSNVIVSASSFPQRRESRKS